MNQEFYTVNEVAQEMRVTDRTVYRWIKTGVIKGIQVVRGGEYRIARTELEKLRNK